MGRKVEKNLRKGRLNGGKKEKKRRRLPFTDANLFKVCGSVDVFRSWNTKGIFSSFLASSCCAQLSFGKTGSFEERSGKDVQQLLTYWRLYARVPTCC